MKKRQVHGTKGGFSLLEVVFAMAILMIALIGLAITQGSFSLQTADRTVQNCLIDGSSRVLTQCQAGLTRDTSYACGGTGESISVTLGISGICKEALADDQCTNVTATASAKGKSMSLTTQVCKWAGS